MRERAACLVVALALVGCIPQGEDGGTLGREGAVRFRGETDLAFTAPLVVGSSFTLSAEKANDEVKLEGAKLVSSDKDVLVIEDASIKKGAVRIKGKGKADLRVELDGKLVDAVAVNAAEPAATALVDGAMFGATDQVDARLPKKFALLSGESVTLLVAAVDACGTDLLDLHASTITSEGVQATIESGSAATFTVQPAEAGALSLILTTPGLKDLTYDVDVIVADDIDEVKAVVASAEESTANVWARALANEVDVVGALEFDFTPSERVTSSAVSGLATVCTISFPDNGEAPDDRPATLTAELFGEEDTVDFLTLKEEQLVQSRGKPAREAPVAEPATPSCGDSGAASGTCGALLVGLGSLRRLRSARVRTRSAA